MKIQYNKEFYTGLIIGILSGIAGNIWVTSMYRIMDSLGGKNIIADILTFIAGSIGFYLIIRFLFRNLNSAKSS